MGECSSVFGEESYRNAAGIHTMGRRNHRLFERNELVSQAHGLRNITEDSTHGKH